MIYGRSIRQLVTVWIVAISALALLYRFETASPAFHELLIPFYWIIVAAAAVLTWRWLRSRSTSDRRENDRRRLSRREGPESSQAAAPEREEK